MTPFGTTPRLPSGKPASLDVIGSRPVARTTGPRDHRGRVIDFGQVAADYDRYRPGFPESFFEQLAARGWLETGARCLDLGTGTGSVALGVARRGLDVVGLDLSAELLEVARQRAEREQVNIRWIQARAEATRLPDGAFDLVTAGQCWWWFDEEAVIAEVQRVLRPGGRLIIATFSYLPIPRTVAGRTEALILEYNPGWPKAGELGIDLAQIALLDRKRFADIETFSYVQTVRFDHEGWRGRIRACNGVGAALAPDVVERFDRALAAMLAKEFDDTLHILHRVHVGSGLNLAPLPR